MKLRAFAAAAILASFGCSPKDDSQSAQSTSACGLPYGTDVCASCVSSECCAESNACAADPACTAYESCLGACKGDPKCRSQCAIDHPAGATARISALSACVASRCESACNLTCGGIVAPVPQAAATCQTCLAANACSAARACATSAACDAVSQCTQGCVTLDCVEACEATDAGAVGAPLATSIEGVCSAACAWGSNWECVGRVAWPSGAAGASSISVGVEDYASARRLAGVSVAACSPTDIECAEPLAEGQTDTSGAVTLQVAALPAVPLTGSLRLTYPNTVPLRFFWGFPLSGPVTFDGRRSMMLETTAELMAGAASLGVTQDPTRGIVMGRVQDCSLAPAEGARATASTSDALTRAFYGATGSTTQMSTDSTGIVMFFNVPPGTVDLTATPDSIGSPSSQVTVSVQAGTITLVDMPPTP